MRTASGQPSSKQCTSWMSKEGHDLTRGTTAAEDQGHWGVVGGAPARLGKIDGASICGKSDGRRARRREGGPRSGWGVDWEIEGLEEPYARAADVVAFLQRIVARRL